MRKIWQSGGFAEMLGGLTGLRRVLWESPEQAEEHLPAAGGAQLNEICPRGVPLLHIAAISPMPAAAAAVRALLAAGARPEQTDAIGAPAACWAARWGTAEMLDILTAAELPLRDEAGRQITHWWAMGDPDRGEATEDVLKGLGCGFLPPDARGATPAHWAAAVGGRMRRLLAIEPGAWTVPDGQGFPPIFWAAGAGCSYAAVPELLEAGERPDAKAGGRTAADVAADPEGWARAAGHSAPPADFGP